MAPAHVRPGTAGEHELVLAARGGDRCARERLVASRLDTVRAVASRYRGLGLPLEDLVQEGSLGLLEAIERFDPGRRTDFDAFARFYVRRAIRNALTNQARLVRLPKQVVERRRLLARAEAESTAETGRPPTTAELAATTGLSAAAVTEARTAAISPMSLDELATADGAPLEALVADTAAADPERELLERERSRLVHDAVVGLSPRQREIVSRHFGIGGREDPIAVVARDLELSQRRTRTIEHDALNRIAAELVPSLL